MFRVFRKPILLEPEKAEKIVLAATHLHNFLRKSESSSATYTPSGTFDVENTVTHELIPGQWRIEGMPTGSLLRLKRVPKNRQCWLLKLEENSHATLLVAKDVYPGKMNMHKSETKNTE